MRLRKLGLTDEQRAGFVSWFTSGHRTGLSQLDPSVLGHIAEVVTAIEEGKFELKTDGAQAWATEPEKKADAPLAVPDDWTPEPVMTVQEAGGFSADEFKAAMNAAVGVGQATLIRQARAIAEKHGIDPGTITSINAIAKAPLNLQSAVMDWLKKGH